MEISITNFPDDARGSGSYYNTDPSITGTKEGWQVKSVGTFVIDHWEKKLYLPGTEDRAGTGCAMANFETKDEVINAAKSIKLALTDWEKEWKKHTTKKHESKN